jgi:outer membrane protein OmpA-like peptidoglycan-associated protein
MATSALLNQLSDEFGGEIVNRIATTIGESPGKIRDALGDLLPVLLGGLATKAQTDEGAHELLDVIHRDHLDTERYEHVADALQEPGSLGSLIHTGEPLLDTVLPGKSNVVSDWVASHTGINPSSSKSLMSLALPLVLGMVGRRVGGGGESGLKALLGKPLGFLQDAPAGLAGVLGMGSSAAASAEANARARMHKAGLPHAKETDAATPKRIWLWPLILLLAIIALMWYYLGNRPTDQAGLPATGSIDRDAADSPATSALAPLTPAIPGATEADIAEAGFALSIDKKLPNGTVLHIPGNSVEGRLIAFLDDKNQPVSADTWFTFNRLEFETNSSQLQASSDEQLRNIAEIMKAYPQAQLKIGGYTDNTGSPQRNLGLSRARAASAMNRIVALGVDASRMKAEGYGDQHPIADNGTEEGREKNRRIDVNVMAK